MYLYLIQHALSKSKEDDPERGITDAGRAETEKIAEYFRTLNPEIHVIWQSGKKRAKETAEIFARRWVSITEYWNIQIFHPMILSDPLHPFWRKMHKDLIIVGHMPFLPRLLSHLTTGTDTCQIVNFKNSGIICLERNDKQWGVNWITTPENVRS